MSVRLLQQVQINYSNFEIINNGIVWNRRGTGAPHCVELEINPVLPVCWDFCTCLSFGSLMSQTVASFEASCGLSEIEPSLTLAIIIYQVWIVCEQLRCRNFYHFVVECDTLPENLLVYKLHSPPYTSAFLPHTICLLKFHKRINDSFNLIAAKICLKK